MRTLWKIIGTFGAVTALFGLLACGTGPRTEVIQDPIFPENYLIFHEDGTDYMLRDPITSNKDFDNFILFRGQRHGEEKK